MILFIVEQLITLIIIIFTFLVLRKKNGKNRNLNRIQIILIVVYAFLLAYIYLTGAYIEIQSLFERNSNLYLMDLLFRFILVVSNGVFFYRLNKK